MNILEILEAILGLYFGWLVDEIGVFLCEFVDGLEGDEIRLIIGSHTAAIIGSDIGIGIGLNVCANKTYSLLYMLMLV